MQNRNSIFLLLPLFYSCTLFGQNDMIANVNMQFRFANPGARSLAMGGAFVGLADDQTVIFANPAGLTRLRQRTVSLELAQFQNDHPIPFYGGEIVQTGIQDLDFNLQSRDFPEDQFTVPFFSIIFPGTRWNWGFFYASQADSNRSFNTNSVYIPDAPFEIRPVNRHQDYYFFPSDNELKMSLESVGGSLGWKITDAFSIGGTLAISRLDYSGKTALNLPAFAAPNLQFLEPLFGEPLAIIEAKGRETGFSGVFGMLFQPNDRFRVGATFQHFPEFGYEYSVNERNIDFASVTFLPYETSDHGKSAFHVPDNAALGVSMQSTEAFLISVEIKRVFYSELVEEYYHFFEQNGNDQNVADATEYHFGMEYFFLNSSVPFSLRAGYWFEPYHALTNVLADTQIIFRDETGELGVRNAVFLQRFEHDLAHYTFGIGLSIRGNFQLDLATDYSEETRTISASGTYRF